MELEKLLRKKLIKKFVMTLKYKFSWVGKKNEYY